MKKALALLVSFLERLEIESWLRSDGHLKKSLSSPSGGLTTGEKAIKTLTD
jgi:hypothetical protein